MKNMKNKSRIRKQHYVKNPVDKLQNLVSQKPNE